MLFAVALIISGQSSTLTGTLSGQIIMEGYLNLRISPVARRMITRSLAVIPAFLVIWISGPSKVGSLLVFSQVVLSFQLGFALIPLVHWVSSKRIMGMFQVKRLIRLAAWATVAVIVGLNLSLFEGSLRNALERSTHPLVTYLLVIPVSIAIIILLLYILFEPVISRRLIPALSPTHHFDDAFELGTPEPFRRIAITIDFTKADQSTLKYALSQGGKEADYFLIHIVESAGARLMNAEITDKESSEDEGFIGKYAQHLLDMGYRAEAIIDYGVAGSMIPDVVGHIGADLLVMSSHRKGFIHRLFKGTTIRKVQQRVNIPMMILK
jgi:manganese transport protein